MKTPPELPAWWLLLLTDKVRVSGLGEEGEIRFEAHTLYDDLPFQLCKPCKRTSRGRHLLRMPLGNGTSAVVCGRTTKEAVRAGVLARIATTRCLPSAAASAPTVVDLPLRDDDLILIIRTIFGDAPQVIAEAVMALRKLTGRHDGGLLGLLDSRRELRPLFRAVNSVLTGDSS